jgi:hypothetical protein
MASYTNNQTGEIAPQFYQALAIYIWAWFILTVLFTVAAMRSSWVLFIDLLVLSLSLLLLASGNMVGSTPLLSSGYCFGLVVAFLSCMSNSELTPYLWLALVNLANSYYRLGWGGWIMGWRNHSYPASNLQNVQRLLKEEGGESFSTLGVRRHIREKLST